MDNGRYVEIDGKTIFIEFGKDISKQIIEQSSVEPIKVEIKKPKKGK